VKTRRYSEAQVIRILQGVDGGKSVVIAARGHGDFPGDHSSLEKQVWRDDPL